MIYVSLIALILAIGILYCTKKKQRYKNIIHITCNMFNNKLHNRVNLK